jgi:phage shock protein C
MSCERDLKHGLYRSRSGLIFGVCKGLAEHLTLPVWGIRVLFFFATFFTGIWPGIIAYVAAGVLIKPEPVVPFANEGDREFYESYASSHALGADRLRRTYESLDRRIRRMESIVTSRDYGWDKKMREWDSRMKTSPSDKESSES